MEALKYILQVIQFITFGAGQALLVSWIVLAFRKNVIVPAMKWIGLAFVYLSISVWIVYMFLMFI